MPRVNLSGMNGRRCADTLSPKATSRPARSPISRRIRRTTRRCTPGSISSAASKRTRHTRRTPRRRSRTSAIAHGIQAQGCCDATLLQAQFAHLQRLKREVANGGPYLFVLLYRLGSHRLEHLVRIDRWGFHLIFLPTLEFTCSRLESARYCMCWPPFIAILAPVTNAAPSEHR